MLYEEVFDKLNGDEKIYVFWDSVANTKSFNINMINNAINNLNRKQVVMNIGDDEYREHFLNVPNMIYLPYLIEIYINDPGNVFESTIEESFNSFIKSEFNLFEAEFLEDQSIEFLNSLCSINDVEVLTVYNNTIQIANCLKNHDVLIDKVSFVDLEFDKWLGKSNTNKNYVLLTNKKIHNANAILLNNLNYEHR